MDSTTLQSEIASLCAADANLLRAIHFDHPAQIPMSFHINDSCWHHYPQEEIARLIDAHPRLFPAGAPSLPHAPEYMPYARKDAPYTDVFGCVWETADDGITGSVHTHPLSDLSKLGEYAFPAPPELKDELGWVTPPSDGVLGQGFVRHGHTFLQLQDICGYTNLLYAMVDGDANLKILIERLCEYNLAVIDNYLQAGCRFIGIPEDLGMQVGPMLSPDQFREYILPSYHRMAAAVHDAGATLHMHSDGDIRSLWQGLATGDFHAFNLQDRVNGLDWIEENLKGRICIDLDIDRQDVTVRGTPKDIHAWIDECVLRLGDPAGGLMMIYGWYPGVPLENAEALMDAMERNLDL